MAPSPEHDNEPKAPDKKNSTGINKFGSDLLDLDISSTGELQESSVSTLDDGQLKALLDEALDYKCPKDREGKSKIFKVLLQEAEEDERNARAASASGPQLARYYNTSAAAGLRHRHRGGGRVHAHSVAESLTHGGSLQNLAQPELFDTGGYLGGGGGQCRRRAGNSAAKHGKPGTVSARQREGGSLPSNVNSTGQSAVRSHFEPGRFDVRRGIGGKLSADVGAGAGDGSGREDKDGGRTDARHEYLAEGTAEETKKLVEHDHLGNDYESAAHSTLYPLLHDGCGPLAQQNPIAMEQDGIQNIPLVTKSRFSPLPKGNIQTDTPITFSQFISSASSIEATGSPLSLDANSNSVKSILDATGHGEKCESSLSLKPTSCKLTSSSGGLMGRPFQELTHGPKKTFDENANALDTNGKNKKKKPRSDRKVTILKSEQVAGHRADIICNIEELVKYVESSNDGGSGSAKRGAKHHHQQRRSASGRTLNAKPSKAAENHTVKKSNSLEEISTSKLKDLVPGKGDRRSWGTEDGEQYYCKKLQQEQSSEALHTAQLDVAVEMSEFQVVNKKKKSRKRRPETAATISVPATETPSSHVSSGHRNRRKSSCSMPVSDKSDSSDVDSVHSLPVSAKLPAALSYADKAQRGNSAISNVSVSGSVVAVEHRKPTPLLNSVEQFPELCARGVVLTNSVVRPAVIIPVSTREPIEVSGLTFGFELNEQLLAENNSGTGGGNAIDIHTTPAAPMTEPVRHIPPPPVVNTADSFTARYVPPVVLNNYNHDKIVSYVGQEWEKIVHQQGGKVRYYSGQ